MSHAEIEVGEPWDAFLTLRKLDELEEMVKDFVSHTMRTLSSPRFIDTPFGPQEIDGEVIHPLGNVIGVLDACRRGCHAAYGAQQYKQFTMFEEQVNG